MSLKQKSKKKLRPFCKQNLFVFLYRECVFNESINPLFIHCNITKYIHTYQFQNTLKFNWQNKTTKV